MRESIYEKGNVMKLSQVFDDKKTAKLYGLSNRKVFAERNSNAIGFSFRVKKQKSGRYALYDNF